MNKSTLCRTCMNDKASVDIYEQDIIQKLTPFITLEESDDLPKNICSECLAKLEMCHGFRKLCQETESALRSLIAANKANEMEMETKAELVSSSEGGCSEDETETKPTPKSTNRKSKLFVCEICNKEYVQKSGLECHMRVHTGERPFLCSHCGKGFIRADDLARHNRIHTGDSPFVCKCGKGFKQKFHLSEHQRSHRGKKEYSCDDCGKQMLKPCKKCAVVGCHRTENVSSFNFPDPKKSWDRFMNWVKATGNEKLAKRSPVDVRRSHRICSRHFRGEDLIVTEMYTKPRRDAVPVLHLPDEALSLPMAIDLPSTSSLTRHQ